MESNKEYAEMIAREASINWSLPTDKICIKNAIQNVIEWLNDMNVTVFENSSDEEYQISKLKQKMEEDAVN